MDNKINVSIDLVQLAKQLNDLDYNNLILTLFAGAGAFKWSLIKEIYLLMANEDKIMLQENVIKSYFVQRLWHAFTIIPGFYMPVLAISKKGAVHTFTINNDKAWNRIAKDFSIERWCYIDDLLPKVGE